MPAKAKPKAKSASRKKPRKPATAPKSSPKPRAGARMDTTSASTLIDKRIRDVGGWRGTTLARMRALIRQADPGIIEGCKWAKPSNPWGVPVWSHDGIVCTGEIYNEVVKFTFARGATIPDPARLFNSSLQGGTRRAIDIHEGETIDADAFKALIKAAVAQNGSATT